MSDTFCSKKEYLTLLLFGITMIDEKDCLDKEKNDNPIWEELVKLVNILLEIEAENKEYDD